MKPIFLFIAFAFIGCSNSHESASKDSPLNGSENRPFPQMGEARLYAIQAGTIGTSTIQHTTENGQPKTRFDAWFDMPCWKRNVSFSYLPEAREHRLIMWTHTVVKEMAHAGYSCYGNADIKKSFVVDGHYEHFEQPSMQLGESAGAEPVLVQLENVLKVVPVTNTRIIGVHQSEETIEKTIIDIEIPLSSCVNKLGPVNYYLTNRSDTNRSDGQYNLVFAATEIQTKESEQTTCEAPAVEVKSIKVNAKISDLANINLLSL